MRDPQKAINLLQRFIRYITETLPEEYIPYGLLDEAAEYILELSLKAPPTLSGGRDND